MTKKLKMKYETKKIDACYGQAWYDGTGSIDGGEPVCPCCCHTISSDCNDFGMYECAADSTIEPTSSGVPDKCPLEDDNNSTPEQERIDAVIKELEKIRRCVTIKQIDNCVSRAIALLQEGWK